MPTTAPLSVIDAKYNALNDPYNQSVIAQDVRAQAGADSDGVGYTVGTPAIASSLLASSTFVPILLFGGLIGLIWYWKVRNAKRILKDNASGNVQLGAYRHARQIHRRTSRRGSRR